MPLAMIDPLSADAGAGWRLHHPRRPRRWKSSSRQAPATGCQHGHLSISALVPMCVPPPVAVTSYIVTMPASRNFAQPATRSVSRRGYVSFAPDAERFLRRPVGDREQHRLLCRLMRIALPGRHDEDVVLAPIAAPYRRLASSRRLRRRRRSCHRSSGRARRETLSAAWRAQAPIVGSTGPPVMGLA